MHYAKIEDTFIPWGLTPKRKAQQSYRGQSSRGSCTGRFDGPLPEGLLQRRGISRHNWLDIH